MSAPLASDTTQAPVAIQDKEGANCPGCRQPLPIRAKQAGETAGHWECAACRSPVTGILLKEAAVQAAGVIRISQHHFDTTGVRPPSASLRQLVGEFVACRQKNPEVDERRAVQRVPMLLDLVLVPVDDNWTPRAKPILGLMIDITANGLGMVTSAPVEAEHLAVQIRHPAGPMQLLGRIAWSKDFGPGFHNAGIQFLLRFGRG
jgi:hypothetical protein